MTNNHSGPIIATDNHASLTGRWITAFSKLCLCFCAALLISSALFWFMQRLINQPTAHIPGAQFSGFVELFTAQPEQQVEPETPDPVPEEQEPEFQPQSLNLAQQSNTDIEMPVDEQQPFQLSDSDLLGGFGTGAQQNVEVARELLSDFGDDSQQGFIEITPFATRRPNIPEVAFENQLNGWVLVIFNVSASGKTRNIKILDAHPKGIFEQEVMRAVSHWHYNVKDHIRDGQDLVLTQKITLNWQNFHQNTPYD